MLDQGNAVFERRHLSVPTDALSSFVQPEAARGSPRHSLFDLQRCSALYK